MNLKHIVNLILTPTAPWIRNEGEQIYKNNLVYNIKSKKIDTLYHIYGYVYEHNKVKSYTTHIIIDLSTNTLNAIKCSCEESKNNSLYNKKFICKHTIATIYSFYNLVLKKSQKSDSRKNENTILKLGDIILKNLDNKAKEPLNLNLKISYIPNPTSNYYNVMFKIGKKTTYLINDLNDFIDKYTNKKLFFINNEFTYNPKIHCFSEKDRKLLGFIEEYVLINKELSNSSNFNLIKGKSLNLIPKSLKSFLKILDDKSFNFKYEYFDVMTNALHKDLPISFTIKIEENNLALTTKNKIPMPLIDSGEVYFYERQLYIPSEYQNHIYINLYKNFKNSEKILFTKNKDTLLKLTNLLTSITSNIFTDEGVKKLISNYSSVKFYFDRSQDISCNVKINYGGEDIDIINDSPLKEEIFRDLIKEEKIKMILEKYRFIIKNRNFIFIGTDEDLFTFLKNGTNILREFGDLILSDEFMKIKLFNSSIIESNITRENNSLKLSYKIENLNNTEIQNLFFAYNNKKTFYKTNDNSFIDLEDAETSSFLNLVDTLSENTVFKGESIIFNNSKSIYVNEQIKNNNLTFIKGNEVLTKLIDKITKLDNLDYKIPSDLAATLRDYQITGFKWLKSLNSVGFSGILADEMGLGKTIQTITFLLSEKGKKTLIVTPTSLIYNWKDEFNNFAPTLKIGIIHGNKDDRIKILSKSENFDVLLTTYGTLKNDFINYNGKYFDFLVIDEGQNIKNPSSQNTDVIKNLNSTMRIALTGTPIENNLIELWSIFDFIMPSYLYSKEIFQEKFINGDEESIKELKNLIRPFILRRVKKDVAKELPNKIEKKFLVEMTSTQKNIYKSYINDIRRRLKENKDDKITIFSYLTKLRQLCLDPSLLIENYKGGSGKIRLVESLIEKGLFEEKKILLFSQFTSILNNISTILDRSHVKYLYLDGSTKSKDRIDLVNKFNLSGDIKIFLISLKAGGTGLNLTSANLVIHFDPWWNPAIENQATDRAHRIGQNNCVEVIKLVSEGTIEEKIIHLQEDKKDLINNIFNGDLQSGTLLSKLSEKELFDLFN